MPINNATNPHASITCVPGNHVLPAFQCKEGYGQFINEINNTDRNPQWLQSLRRQKAITLEIEGECYNIGMDKTCDITVTCEKILSGNTSLNTKAADIKIQVEKKYYHALWDQYPVWEKWKNDTPPGSNEQRDQALAQLQIYLKFASPDFKGFGFHTGYFDFSNHHLSSLPELPPDIKFLNVANNQLTELPALPSSVEDLNASNNQLTQLPESITRLPRRARVNVNANPLSERTLQDLQRLNTNRNYQGPQIHFSMDGSVAKRPLQPLSDVVITWFPAEKRESIAAQWTPVNKRRKCSGIQCLPGLSG